CNSSATSDAMRSTCSSRFGRSSSAANEAPAADASTNRHTPPNVKCLATGPGIGLARGLHVICDKMIGDLTTHHFTHVERIAEMDAAPDAYLFMFVGHLLEASKVARQARIYDIGRREGRRLGPEHCFENSSRGAGVDPRL